MYQTSWLSILGLLIEMIGLSLLFTDLLRAKSLTDSTTAIRTLQEDINVSTRDLMMNLNKHVALLSNFMGKYVAILAREAEFEAEPRSVVGEQPDPERAKLVALLLDKGPDGFRQVTAREFLHASRNLPTAEKIQEAVALNLVSSAEILRKFDQYQRTSKRLRRVAAAGVFLVGAGALLQFTDLLT